MNARNHERETALHLAVRANHPQAVRRIQAHSEEYTFVHCPLASVTRHPQGPPRLIRPGPAFVRTPPRPALVSPRLGAPRRRNAIDYWLEPNEDGMLWKLDQGTLATGWSLVNGASYGGYGRRQYIKAATNGLGCWFR